MGDVLTKTVSFKKLSGKDLDNSKIRKLEKMDLVSIFVPKTVIYDRRININSNYFHLKRKNSTFGENCPLLI